MEQKPVDVEIDPVTIDVHGTMIIAIPFDMYNSLLEIKGRYEEIKANDEENKEFMDEYKELLVIKGKYEELSSMFANQESTIMPKSEAPKAMLCTNIHKGKKPEVEVENDILNCNIEEPEVEA